MRSLKRMFLAGVVATAGLSTCSAYSQHYPTLRQSDRASASGQTQDTNRQWLITLTGMIITGVAAPVLINQFKSKDERDSQNLNYAWDAARENQKQLVAAKDESISRLKEELDAARKAIEKLEERCDDLHERIIRSEMKCLEYMRRLSKHENVTGKGLFEPDDEEG